MGRRLWIMAAVALAAACGPGRDGDGDAEPVEFQPLVGGWEWAQAGAWRTPAERALDASRRPIETLEFFRVESGETVLEAWPGAGWWTALVAPYLAAGEGVYIAAAPAPLRLDPRVEALETAFFDRFADVRVYGQVVRAQLGPETDALAPNGSVDAALAFRAVQAWIALGFAEKAFADVYGALKPGGRFGVVEARAPETAALDPAASTGYVRESFVVRLAEEAGFELVAASELNANPIDDADHPFGVWTLEPYYLGAPLGAPDDPAFDHAPFQAIGAPDQMTLLFRKPLDG